MNGADVVDLLAEVSGKRVARALIVAFAVGPTFFHDTAIHVLNWYVSQRAHELTDHIFKIVNAHPSPTK